MFYPMLEDAAFERAVKGSLQPLTRLGKVIGERRRYSDSLLRFLIEREDRRERAAAADVRAAGVTLPSPEETDRELLARLELLARRKGKRQREEAIAFADRMTRDGKAP